MEKSQKRLSKGNLCVMLVGMLILFVVTGFMLSASPAIAGEPLKLSNPQCDCSVEKAKDGQEEFILTGDGCKTVAEGVKQTAAKSQTKAYSGSNCVGMCKCTWYDNLGKRGGFVCRGCCREILSAMP